MLAAGEPAGEGFNLKRDNLRDRIARGADRAVQAIGSATPTTTAPTETALYVPLSPEGAAIRDQLRRPAGTYARDILSRPLVDLSWVSSRLEGNTYSPT